LLLAVASLHRETALALLPAGVFALIAWPRPHRGRAAAWAAAGFVACMVAVFWPLYRARPPYPHALSFLLDAAAESGAAPIAETLGRNLRPWARPDVWLAVYALEWLCAVAAAGLAGGAPPLGRRLARWGALTLLVTFAALAPLYWLRGWTAVRMFLFTLPPCLVALTAGPARTLLRRHGVPAATLAVFAAAGVPANGWLARDRGEEAERGHAYAIFVRAHTAAVTPRVVIAPAAFRYGWDSGGVTVVDAEIDGGRLAALASRLPVDVVVTRRTTPSFLALLARHGFERTSFAPYEGRHVYVRQARPALDRPVAAR
jgi:hypothetical protein